MLRLLPAVALLAVVSCTCKPPCELASCGGCCAAGVCQPGNTADACGSAGLACVACPAGRECSAGVCVTASAGGGGGGGEMAGAGGGMTGGGAAGGGTGGGGVG